MLPDGFKSGKTYLCDIKENSVSMHLNKHYTTVTTLTFFNEYFIPYRRTK
jgi:hypothetical protein